MGIKLINPSKTLPISVTGKRCELRCKHCNAKYLNHMVPIENLDNINVDKYKSFLVSGGSNKNGVIPFKPNHFETLQKYDQRKNFHTGLIEDDFMAKNVSELADSISLDIVFNDETVKYVYNLDKTKKDYRNTLETFLKYSKNVFPHVTIGLRGGKLSHEFSSIDMLSDYHELKAVVFLILIPTKNTFFENTPYTTLSDIEKVFAYAKEKLKTKIILGCMKPHGQYGEKIDLLSQKYVDAIVKPTKKIGEAKNNECCVLYYL